MSIGMTPRVRIDPKLLKWARDRTGIAHEILLAKFPKLPDWESGESRPTLKQVETFARAVHVHFGYLFLSEPPKEALPIPDFRTFASKGVRRPSPNLLDTIRICRRRQNWYRDYVRTEGEPELPFVGSASIESSPEIVAARISETLGFDILARQSCRTWTEALRFFIRQADEASILVIVSGIVMSNNQRRLDPKEFRGFALSDPLAPLVFVNGADTKAAQMFTLAHELGHLWLGKSALSNMDPARRSVFRREEVWCNAVAAELLVPLAALRPKLGVDEKIQDLANRLVREFKVSALVI